MTKGRTVVRVITWLPIGGIERRLVAVVPRLREFGWNPRVVCLREEGPLAKELREAGVPVDVIPFSSRLSPVCLRRLAAYLRGTGASVVHSHMYRSNIPATIAGRMARRPVILGQVHNVDSWNTARQTMLDRMLCRLRTGTIAVSRAVQRDVMKRLNEPESRVPVLYNGVDIDRFRIDSAARVRTRRELGISEETFVFLVPARLHPQKNPVGTLEAFRTAMKGRDAVMLFAGDGKLEEEMKEIVRRESLENVGLLGARNDMADLYNAADCMVLSSFKEGFSNAVVEALACGKPVIASDVGGNREAVNNERVGWIHDAGDGAALGSQLLSAFTEGRGGMARRAADCRARAEDFSLDALLRNTDALYRTSLAGAEGVGG